jgi:hypothetical protein
MWRLLALAVSAAVLAAPGPAMAGDPYAFFDWDVSYVTAAPLGVKQQVRQASNRQALSSSFPILVSDFGASSFLAGR